MGAELLAPVGLQAKAESTNCFKIYSKCFRFQNILTYIDIKFLSLFFCSSACKEMFCLVDILKIGVITYRMVFWWSRDRGGSRGRVQGVRTLPWDYLRFSHTTGILQKKKLWFIGVEVEQETSAPPPKKNPGSAPERRPSLTGLILHWKGFSKILK